MHCQITEKTHCRYLGKREGEGGGLTAQPGHVGVEGVADLGHVDHDGPKMTGVNGVGGITGVGASERVVPAMTFSLDS